MSADLFVGMTITPDGTDDALRGMLDRLIGTYQKPGAAEAALAKVQDFTKNMRDILKLKRRTPLLMPM